MITYRQTQGGEWVAFGPACEIVAGATIAVTKKSGETKTEQVARIGRPFAASGVEMVYGYLGPRTAQQGTQKRRGTWSGCRCGSFLEYTRASDCEQCVFDGDGDM